MSSIFTPFFLLSVAASLSIVSEYALQHPAISAVSFAFFAMVIGVQSLFRVDGAPQSHITKEIATARGIITGFVAISYFSSVRFSFISSVPAYASLSATYSKVGDAEPAKYLDAAHFIKEGSLFNIVQQSYTEIRISETLCHLESHSCSSRSYDGHILKLSIPDIHDPRN